MQFDGIRSIRRLFLRGVGTFAATELFLRGQLDWALVGHGSPEFEVVASSIEAVAANHAQSLLPPILV